MQTCFQIQKMCFLGYNIVHKGYKCLDVFTSGVYISRDIVFEETVFPFSKLHANAGAQLCAEIILLHPTLIPSGVIMLVLITVKLILIILLMNRLLKCLFLMQLVETVTIPCKIQKVQMILSLVPEWNCLCYQAVQDNRIRSWSYSHHVASKLNTQGHPPSGPVWLIIQLNQLPLHLLHHTSSSSTNNTSSCY